MTKRTLLTVTLYFSCSIANAATTVVTKFSLGTSSKVTATIMDNRLHYRAEGKLRSSGIISVDTEKAIRVDVGDYNFDGINDLSIWYSDEGMGVFKIYHVFIYSKKKKKFIEQRPACGDEFMNLRINKYRHYLESTYFKESISKICVTRLSKNID